MKQIEKGSYLDWILGTPAKSWLDGEPDYETSRPMVISRLYCMDGESVSIQASEYMYCTPRENYPGWDKVEAGYPSCIPPLTWKEFSEQWDINLHDRIQRFFHGAKFAIDADVKYGKEGSKLRRFLNGFFRGFKREFNILMIKQPCNTIYAYMPVELVKQFITAHGGEDTKKCFDMLEKQKENGH